MPDFPLRPVHADTLIAELAGVEELQDRIDLVAKDLRSNERRFAVIAGWQLAELLEIDFADGSHCRIFWGYRAKIEVSTAFISLPSSIPGVTVDFEAVLDRDDVTEVYSPYQLMDGERFDSSGYTQLE